MYAHLIERLPRSLIWGALLALVLGLGYFDFLTGPELSFSIFYLGPIMIGVWYLGSWAGHGFSILSALVWYTADLAAGSQYSSAAIPFWNAGVRLGFFVIQSVVLSRLKLMLVRERRFARTDFLTGAHNKRSFLRQIDKEIDRARRHAHIFSVAYLDIDDFKQVNDRQGHAAGDRLLQQVAATLDSAVRSTDTVARIGGDEFAILLAEPDPAQTEQAGLRIHALLEETARTHFLPVGFSLGMITFLSVPESPEIALGMADQLMYEVKKSGKNRLQFVTWHDGQDLPAKITLTPPSDQETIEQKTMSNNAGALGHQSGE